MGSDFDRIKPPRRRLPARRGGPGAEPADAWGRAAVFTGAPDAGAPEAGAPGLTLHCSRCDASTSVDAPAALRVAFPLFLLLPWRRHPLFGLCPACRHRAWLRPVPGPR